MARIADNDRAVTGLRVKTVLLHAWRVRVGACLKFLAIVSLFHASQAPAANILIYEPSQPVGSVTNTLLANLGHSVTFAGSAQWCGMSTSDFGSFDALFFDGQFSFSGGFNQPGSCADAVAGTPGTSSWADIIIETETQWGPAVSGPLYLSTGDSSFHAGAPGPDRVIENAATWAVSDGSSQSGGNTGMAMFTGSLETASGVFLLDLLSVTLGPIESTANDAEGTAVLNPAHSANNTPNQLTSADYVWLNLCHGSIASVPPGYVPLVECSDGNFGAVARPSISPVPIPAAIWFFATALVGLAAVRRGVNGGFVH